MRRIAAQQIATGMVLARPIKDVQGRMLVAAGARLSPGIRPRIEGAGVESVYVEDPRFEGLDLDDEVPAKVMAAAAALFEEGAGHGKCAVPPRPVGHLLDLVEQCTDTVGAIALVRPTEEERYLPIQAVNGARLCLAAAPLVGLGGHARDLAAAALLRDIGMLGVPLEWRHRAGVLAPEEMAEVRQHVADGLQALGDPYWSPFVKTGIAQHHERLDGSGYPRGVHGTEFHPAGALLAAVDCVCALMSPRPYREALSPEEAMDTLLGMADWLFPAAIVRAITHCIGLYPMGAVVRLSTGEAAVVVFPGRGTFQRPRVRLLADGRVIDLAEHLNVQIAGIADL